MPNKNNNFGVGGYAYFARQAMPYWEKKLGHPVSLRDSIASCSETWQAFSPREKDEWKDRAKEYKQSERWERERTAARDHRIRNKLDRLPSESGPSNRNSGAKPKRRPGIELDKEEHRPLAYYGNSTHMQELFAIKRQADRKTLKDTFEWDLPDQGSSEEMIKARIDWVLKQKFHLMTAISYFEDKCHNVIPAEMCLLTFSLGEEAISKTRTWHIYLGDFFDESKEHLREQAEHRSENSVDGHGIPVNQTVEAVKEWSLTKDYTRIVKRIGMETKNDKFIFVHSANFNTVQGCGQWLNEKYFEVNGKDAPWITSSRFACLEDLVLALNDVLGGNRLELGQDATEIFPQEEPEAQSPYDNDYTTFCEQHCRIRNTNCAQAHAKKLVYHFYNLLKNPFKLKITEKHDPLLKTTAPSFLPLSVGRGRGTVVRELPLEDLGLVGFKRDESGIPPPSGCVIGRGRATPIPAFVGNTVAFGNGTSGLGQGRGRGIRWSKASQMISGQETKSETNEEDTDVRYGYGRGRGTDTNQEDTGTVEGRGGRGRGISSEKRIAQI